MDDAIKIAGITIPMRAFGAGKQLAAAFSNSEELMDGKPLTLTHQMAIAFNAGYTEAKREGVKVIDLRDIIQSLDSVADSLRKLQRTTLE